MVDRFYWRTSSQFHGLDPVSPPGSGRVYFKDPDGNILQLS
jgi:hypothetical protein